MRRTACILTGAIVLLLATLPPGVASKGKSDFEIGLESYARPGTLVKLASGRRLNIRCFGSGTPTVILTAGAGEQSLTWRSLQTQLARTTHICAWDRAGFGFSDPSPQTQDVAHTTDDLEAVLAGSNTQPPYVLVGHSLGSYETLMFAFRHPHEAAGIVLIDPAAPYQNRRLSQAAPHTYAVIDAIQQAQIADLKSCIDMMQRSSQDATFEAKCLPPSMPDYPSSLNRALRQLERNAKAKANFLSLLDNAFTAKDSQEIAGSWKSVGSLPLIVLTAGELPPFPLEAAGLAQKPQLQAEWSKMHDEIAALSTHGVNRTVPGATHYIYVDRQAVVVEAILEVLDVAQGKH